MAKEGINTPSDVALIVGILCLPLGFTFIILGSIIPPFEGIVIWSALILVLGIFTLIGGIILKMKEKNLPVHQQNNTTIKEKETIIKEVVMVPCQYCGSLLPQTSVFCPHCGARRKG